MLVVCFVARCFVLFFAFAVWFRRFCFTLLLFALFHVLLFNFFLVHSIPLLEATTGSGPEDTARNTVKMTDGGVYAGEWKAGKREGTGKFTAANGDVYEGEYSDGKMEGIFKITTARGRVEEVEYKAGIKVKSGLAVNRSLLWLSIAVRSSCAVLGLWCIWTEEQVHVKANGRRWHPQGEFWDGKKHGFGKYTWANGDVYEGEWKDGTQGHGFGKYTLAHGDVYEGEWKDLKQHGRGKYTHVEWKRV